MSVRNRQGGRSSEVVVRRGFTVVTSESVPISKGVVCFTAASEDDTDQEDTGRKKTKTMNWKDKHLPLKYAK